MDAETLWVLYRAMSDSLKTLNREMGMVVARLDWIEWWIKAIVSGTLVNTAVTAFNLWLSYRNHKHNSKKQAKEE